MYGSGVTIGMTKTTIQVVPKKIPEARHRRLPEFFVVARGTTTHPIVARPPGEAIIPRVETTAMDFGWRGHHKKVVVVYPSRN